MIGVLLYSLKFNFDLILLSKTQIFASYYLVYIISDDATPSSLHDPRDPPSLLISLFPQTKSNSSFVMAHGLL